MGRSAAVPGSGTRAWWRGPAPVGALLVMLALSGCVAGGHEVAIAPGSHPAGFWLGLWQGFICPITLIISWFTDSVGIYEVHNNGGWYDFGFVLGVSMFFGGTRGPRAARDRTRARDRRRSAGSVPE